jgi:hypothetical protein
MCSAPASAPISALPKTWPVALSLAVGTCDPFENFGGGLAFRAPGAHEVRAPLDVCRPFFGKDRDRFLGRNGVDHHAPLVFRKLGGKVNHAFYGGARHDEILLAGGLLSSPS